jgi:hypothetical protein
MAAKESIWKSCFRSLKQRWQPVFKVFLACMAAGISYDCFNNWRKQDPDFDAQVEQAAAEPAVKLFKTIREQAPETWQAGAWALERRYPEMLWFYRLRLAGRSGGAIW